MAYLKAKTNRLIVMKKFFIITFVILLLPLTACNGKTSYDSLISDLRYDILYGKGDKFDLKLYVGERETPYVNDGISNPREAVYLKFTLYNSLSEAEHKLAFDIDGNKYLYKMQTSNISYKPTVETVISDFKSKTLTVTVTEGSYIEQIVLTSIVDKNALSYIDALNKLLTTVPSLLNEQNTEFYLKVLVEKDKTYYYVGICNGEKIRAVLLDGITGEILTTKDLY